MFSFGLWQLAFRLIFITLCAQLITVAIITISYKRRRKEMDQGGYEHIDLPELPLEDGTIQLYMEGVSLYADMEESIDSAESTIFFETFIWKNDVAGQRLRDLFVKKAREGVNVCLVYDLIGNGVLGGSRITFPTDIPTLRVSRYFAFKRWYHFLMPSRYNVTHRKLLVVDDRCAFVGGYNIGEEYRTEWRDTHIRVTGPSVRRYSHAFIDFWNHYAARHDDMSYPQSQWSNIMDVYRNDPKRRNFPIRSMYLQAIERAHDHIYITNAYFVPDPTFREALIDAAARGVDVQVILPWESNHLVVDWVARHYFDSYLKAGIKLFGYEAAMIHTKTVTIDGRWSMIGTANLDRLSLWLNHEINAEIFDEGVAAQMEQIFACDLAQTRSITYEDWAKRPHRQRLGEQILAPLWPFV